MPVEFLTDAQVAAFGRFVGPPTRAQLEGYFFLDDDDRRRVAQRRLPHTQLGFAVQLGTVRFLGTFLADPLDVPRAVVAYVAGQLEIDPTCLRAYPERAMTPYHHAWEIRRVYGYREFAAAEGELRAFLAARAWTSNEGPRALFDRATAWLVAHKVLLPGATTLARDDTAVQAAQIGADDGLAMPFDFDELRALVRWHAGHHSGDDEQHQPKQSTAGAIGDTTDRATSGGPDAIVGALRAFAAQPVRHTPWMTAADLAQRVGAAGVHDSQFEADVQALYAAGAVRLMSGGSAGGGNFYEVMPLAPATPPPGLDD